MGYEIEELSFGLSEEEAGTFGKELGHEVDRGGDDTTEP